MLTEKDYCDMGTCVALMEIGYPYYAFGDKLQDEHFANISLYEAQKFLREEKGVIIVITPYTYNAITETNTWTYEIWLGDNLESEINDFNSYEEALSEGIKEAVKFLKEK